VAGTGRGREILTRAAGWLFASFISPPPTHHGRKTGALEASTTVTWEVRLLWMRDVGLSMMAVCLKGLNQRNPPEANITKAGNPGGKPGRVLP
jgi:hypothetical protein